MTLVQATDRALLIGIDKYTGVPPLVGSAHDVQKIRHFAQTYWGYRDDQIKVLLDEQAPRNGILAAIDTWLIRGSQPRDRVLFYYSGHGSQIQDTNGDEEDGYDETLGGYSRITLSPVWSRVWQIAIRMG